MIVLSTLAIVIFVCAVMGIRPQILVTRSMESSVMKNSLLLLGTSARFEELEEDQVIAFRTGDTEVLHRVTGRDGNALIVTPDKGVGEAVVSKSMYIGKEVNSFLFVWGWVRWILGHGMWMVVVLAIGLIVIGCLPWKNRQKAEAGE